MYQFHWIVVEMFHSKTQLYGGARGKTKMITSISGDRPLKNMNVSKVSIDVELSYAPLQVNSFHTLLLRVVAAGCCSCCDINYVYVQIPASSQCLCTSTLFIIQYIVVAFYFPRPLLLLCCHFLIICATMTIHNNVVVFLYLLPIPKVTIALREIVQALFSLSSGM